VLSFLEIYIESETQDAVGLDRELNVKIEKVEIFCGLTKDEFPEDYLENEEARDILGRRGLVLYLREYSYILFVSEVK
jgi:hypothetical protein